MSNGISLGSRLAAHGQAPSIFDSGSKLRRESQAMERTTLKLQCFDASTVLELWQMPSVDPSDRCRWICLTPGSSGGSLDNKHRTCHLRAFHKTSLTQTISQSRHLHPQVSEYLPNRTGNASETARRATPAAFGIASPMLEAHSCGTQSEANK